MNYQTGNSWCYDNNTANCNTYGRMYDWSTALGACPSGWYLPSDAEWCTITQYIDPTVNCNTTGPSGTDAGTKMKSSSGWNSGGNGTNASGFTALPGGYSNINGYFGNLGDFALLWSSTEYSSADAWHRELSNSSEQVYRGHYNGKTHGLSVRCLKD